MSLPTRVDLPLEVDTTLDASGEYLGPWIDSTGMDSLRYISTGTATVEIDYSMDGATVLAPDGWSPGTVKTVLTRYWRVSVTGGTPGGTFRMSVRAVG